MGENGRYVVFRVKERKLTNFTAQSGFGFSKKKKKKGHEWEVFFYKQGRGNSRIYCFGFTRERVDETLDFFHIFFFFTF